MKIYIITGERGGGKTHCLEKINHLLNHNGLTTAGFLSPGAINENGTKDFELLDISTQKKTFLASRSPIPSYFRIGRFYVNPLAMSTGDKIISAALETNPDVIIMDEIGPFELEEKAWFNALKKVLSEYNGIVLLSVRKHLVEKVITKFSVPFAEIIDIDKPGCYDIQNWDLLFLKS